MSISTYVQRILISGLVLVVLGGCGTGSGGVVTSAAPQSEAQTPSLTQTSATATQSSTDSPDTGTSGVVSPESTSAPGAVDYFDKQLRTPAAEYCAGARSEDTAGVTQEVVRTPRGDSLLTLRLRGGPATVVMLHETNSMGSCGFLFFAQSVARAGYSVVLIDLCGQSRSICGTPAPTGSEQVSVVVDQLRRAQPDRRIALLGASYGGAVAVEAANAVKPATIIDLSGPQQFATADLTRDAPGVAAPILLAYSPDDATDLAAARTALQKMPTTTKKLVVVPHGHGYSFLYSAAAPDRPTPVGRQVLAWLAKYLPAT